MSGHLFQLVSANIPGGIWLWVAMVAVGAFIAWFVYKISEVVDSRKFRRWLAGVVVLSTVIYGLFWLKFPPAPRRIHLAIVPTQAFHFSPEAAEEYGLQYRTFLALSRWLPPDRFVVSNPDWIYAVLPRSMASNPDSLPVFFRRIKTDRLLWVAWNNSTGTFILWPQDLQTRGFGQRIQVHGKTLGDALRKSLPKFYRGKKPSLQKSRLERVSFVFQEKGWMAFAKAKLLSLENDSLAQQAFSKWQQSFPQSPLANAALAQIDLKIAFQKRIQGAYTGDLLPVVYPLIVQARKVAPQWSLPYLLAGKYFLALEIWSKVQENLSKSLRLYPNNDELYVLISRLHPSRLQKLGFFGPKKALEEALRVNPASIEGHLFLADALYREHDLRGAETVYQDLLQINPDLRLAQLALAKFYIDVTRYNDAKKILSKIVRQDSTAGEALYDLGMIAYLSGHRARAKSYFLRAVQMGHYWNAYLYLAKIAEDQGDLDTAIAYLRRRIHVKAGPNDPFAEQARQHLRQLLQKKGVL